jgi:hypothetical protein
MRRVQAQHEFGCSDNSDSNEFMLDIDIHAGDKLRARKSWSIECIAQSARMPGRRASITRMVIKSHKETGK